MKCQHAHAYHCPPLPKTCEGIAIKGERYCRHHLAGEKRGEEFTNKLIEKYKLLRMARHQTAQL